MVDVVLFGIHPTNRYIQQILLKNKFGDKFWRNISRSIQTELRIFRDGWI